MSSPVEVLIVDDEARNLDALEAILCDPAYRLLRAQDADTALRLLLTHDVAAIVLDIKMPDINGFDLARMIKDTKRFRGTPIVFLTAHMVEDQDVIAGYGVGGADYLTKPVNPQVLRQKVAVFAELFSKTRELGTVNVELAELNEKLEERVKERTAELEKSEAALRLADQQKDEFLAILAHELRNPLAPLRTGLDLLLRQPGPRTPSVERTFSAMNRQLDHMVRLIDDLLHVSRWSQGSFELRPEALELGNVIETALEGVFAWFERRGQTLSVELERGIVARVDPTRFAQILTNLLHNASKFTPQGGAVSIKLTRDTDAAVVRIVDSGVGIPTDQIERVFDMFLRIRREGGASEPGLGIGLALARRLAEMHEGTLTLSSPGEGLGTTLELRLPVVQSSTQEAEGAGQRPGSSKDSGVPLDIVLVEDNDDGAEVLSTWLEGLGHRVIVARTGQTALDEIRERRPNLVICDLGLPDISGLDVCRGVRQFAGEQPAMVALTGWGRETDVSLSEEAGFDLHLVKPVSPDALDGLLKRVGESLRQTPGRERNSSSATAR
jgi:signal transduction histidine kinase